MAPRCRPRRGRPLSASVAARAADVAATVVITLLRSGVGNGSVWPRLAAW